MDVDAVAVVTLHQPFYVLPGIVSGQVVSKGGAIPIDAEGFDPTEFAATAASMIDIDPIVPEGIEIQLMREVRVTMPVPEDYDRFGRPS